MRRVTLNRNMCRASNHEGSTRCRGTQYGCCFIVPVPIRLLELIIWKILCWIEILPFLVGSFWANWGAPKLDKLQHIHRKQHIFFCQHWIQSRTKETKLGVLNWLRVLSAQRTFTLPGYKWQKSYLHQVMLVVLMNKTVFSACCADIWPRRQVM